MVELLEALSIPAVLLLGAVTSYEDNKKRKVRNKWIMLASLYALIILSAAGIYSYFSVRALNPMYFIQYFINAALSLGFGFFLYICKLWSPGDAKLFFAYSLLIPLSVYEYGSAGYFFSYILLINTFIPLFGYFLIQIILKINLKILFETVKDAFNPRVILSFIIFLFGFSVLSRIFLELLGINNPILNAGFLLLIMILFSSLKINFLIFSIPLCIVRLYLEFNSVFTANFLFSFTLQLLFFLLLRYFIINLSSKLFSKPIYIEDLKEGMCLADDLIEEKENYRKNRRLSISFFNSIQNLFDAKSIFDDFTCLSQDDVNKINKLHSTGKIKEHAILIYEKISFSSFLFLGALITYAARGDVLFFIRSILERFI